MDPPPPASRKPFAWIKMSHLRAWHEVVADRNFARRDPRGYQAMQAAREEQAKREREIEEKIEAKLAEAKQ